MDELCVGELVWACLRGGKMWPGVIVEESLNHDNRKDRKDHYCVFWFGDYRRSLVHRRNVVPFALNFTGKYKNDSKVSYKTAITEAITECARRSQSVNLTDKAGLLNWAKEGFPPHSPDEKLFPPDPANPLPPVVISPYEVRVKPEIALELPGSAVQRVRDGHVTIEEICIACDRSNACVDCAHPLFEGGLCNECKEDLKSTLFISDENGTNDYCTVCGYEGEMIVCDNSERCSRVYCRACITILIGPESFSNAQKQEPWYCYVCQPLNGNKQGLLKTRQDWRNNMLTFCQPIAKIPVLDSECFKKKKPIRVLSLFDGIATGRIALESLGISIDKYYVAEVTADVTNKPASRSQCGAVHLGDVGHLTEATISGLCPVDLLIAKSPSCGDVSLVNPKRKDVNGTGFAFFEYYRILETILRFNGDHPLFWVFENLTSMPREYKGVISRFLRFEPALVESETFTSRYQPRLFWGNVPGLYDLLPDDIPKGSTVLESALNHQCNGGTLSAVGKVEGIKTRRSRGMEKVPAMTNGKEDGERKDGINCLPTCYSNKTENQKSTVCDPVIERILHPLRNYFSLNTNTNSACRDSLKRDDGPSSLTARGTKRRLCVQPDNM